MKKIIKCMVSVINAGGESDFEIVKVKVTEDEYGAGEHYNKAKEYAENQGYDAFLVYDQNDHAGDLILDCFNWKKAVII